MQIPTHFKDEMEQMKLHSCQLVDVEVSICRFFFEKMKTEISHGSHAKDETKRGKRYNKTITAVFFASLLEVRDKELQNPIMLLTMSIGPGRNKSPVSIARRKDCLECIQSRCSASLSRVTMNSVIKKRSSVPNTVEAVFCRQRLSNLTSKVG